ncbi:MAG: hypothetical protein CSA19_00035, partial [Deltaproteobacteria bacterium]
QHLAKNASKTCARWGIFLKKNEKELIFSTLTLFVFAQIGIFSFIYVFLELSFYEKDFVFYALSVSLLLSLPLGYLIARHALAFSFSTNLMLSKLVSEILHELNIPVSTIKGNVFLLKRKEKDEKALSKLRRIDLATDALLDLYEELAFFIKRQINHNPRQTIELKSFIEARLKLFSQKTFNLDLQECSVFVGEQGLKHCFDNIISNAIKYSSSSTPVDIELKNCTLTIKDYGIGIEASEIANIFNRYYQIDSMHKGKGIGLALVKDFCDKEKIKLSLQSKVNVGTSFCLEFKPKER